MLMKDFISLKIGNAQNCTDEYVKIVNGHFQTHQNHWYLI